MNERIKELARDAARDLNDALVRGTMKFTYVQIAGFIDEAALTSTLTDEGSILFAKYVWERLEVRDPEVEQ